MEMLTNFHVDTTLDLRETLRYILQYAIISTVLPDYQSYSDYYK